MAFKINAPFHLEKNHQNGRDNRNEKSTKKPEITAKVGTKGREQQYKDANYAPDHTTHRKKAKTVASSSKGADIKVEAEKPKVSSAKPTKKEAPKSKSVKRKTARLEKTREKGKQALEDGNTSKAMRLKRRERRLKRRIAKKSKK